MKKVRKTKLMQRRQECVEIELHREMMKGTSI
jgi:hypothetical protein